jgi:phosphopantetheine adenylyltransferase
MTAFLLSQDAAAPRLVVGITGEALLINKKHSQLLGTWDHRAIDVIEFLRGISDFSSSSASSLPRVSHASSTPRTPLTPQSFTATISGQHNKILIIEAVEINDPFGPTITNEAITALVVSQETKNGGEAVNKKRMEKGWDPLQVFLIDVIEEEGGGKLSSTEIRRRLEEKQKEEPQV